MSFAEYNGKPSLEEFDIIMGPNCFMAPNAKITDKVIVLSVAIARGKKYGK